MTSTVAENGTARKDAMLNNPDAKPNVLPVMPENVPAELKSIRQWVAWKWVKKQNRREQWRWTKPPYRPGSPNYLASVDDSSTWGTFAEAMAAVANGQADGIGFVLHGGAGIDLDECVAEDGSIAPWAWDIIVEADTYSEVSPTGTGVKMYLRGKLPEGRRHRGHIEMYDDSSNRYFTVTGHRLPDFPFTINERQAQLESLHAKHLGADEPPALPPKTSPHPPGGTNLEDDALIRKAMGAKYGEEFRGLWNGGINGHPSQSEADGDLACRLVWWTGHDGPRVDRLFRLSGLFRPKWDEPHSGDGSTYGQMTINSALAKVVGDYAPGHGSTKTAPPAQPPTSEPAPPKPIAIAIDDLQLVLIDARKTPSKIIGNVAISRAGSRIDVVTISTATSSRREAAKEIVKHAPNADQIKIDLAIGQLMLAATEMAGRTRIREGATVREIVARVIAEDFRPAYRTPGGFFSETRGGEIRGQELTRYTPSRLVDLAEAAADAPVNQAGAVLRTSLLKTIKAELEIHFADLTCTLPLASDANLVEHSAAGREFRGAMIRLLTLPRTWEASKDGAARRASIVSRAAGAIAFQIANGRCASRKWHRVIDATNCWWRVATSPDGELVRLVAIRYELQHQIGVLLPGVTDQESLVALGRKFGVIDPKPIVNDRTDHSSTRLVVLSQAFIEPLLSDAGDFTDGIDGGGGHEN